MGESIPSSEPSLEALRIFESVAAREALKSFREALLTVLNETWRQTEGLEPTERLGRIRQALQQKVRDILGMVKRVGSSRLTQVHLHYQSGVTDRGRSARKRHHEG